jgi:predicted nucleic acid-binding protein
VKDPDWRVPILWRSEMRSEHLVPSASVFEIVGKSRLSAYDCEFVALASVLTVSLVTSDRAVLNAFPQRALSMEAFLSG